MALQMVPFPAGSAPRLEAWLDAPHVARWWKPERSRPALEAIRTGRPLPGGGRAWRIDLDGRPVGYAEDGDPAAQPGAWAAEDGVGAGTRTLALLLGEADAVNRKHGREAIRVLTGMLFAEPGIDRVVAAPHPDNWAAVIAFKRAGFRERGRRQFPDGPVMVLTAAKAVWKG